MKLKGKQNNTYNTLFHWQNFRLKLLFEGILVGLLSGLLVVFYRLLLEEAGMLSTKAYSFISKHQGYIPLWFLFLIIIGIIVGIMVKWEPMISGSGIPQVEGALSRHLDMNWIKVIIGKIVGGALCILGGLSLGREGPSIQIGAAGGQGFSRIFKRIKLEEKYLITGGASAGLAAAFNAPLAGVMFALEEVHKSFSPLILLSSTTAAISADFISKHFFGLGPVFDFKRLSPLSLNNYGFLIILGIVLGILGAVFNSSLMKTFKGYASLKWIPSHFRPIIPFIVAGILGLALPVVMGGGHNLVISLVKENYTLKMLLLILVVKFIFTMISFGSGSPGGIFLPLLSIGAVIGCIYGVILMKAFNMDSIYITNFIILAMAGYFTAVVRAPITGIILITEMTGSLSHLLSLTIVSITAFVVADILKSKPIYESLLERLLSNRGDEIKKDDASRVILEIPVSMGTSIEGKKIKDIKWPESCLLVGVKRGDKELIPRGNTTIYSGDMLIILTDEKHGISASEELKEMVN